MQQSKVDLTLLSYGIRVRRQVYVQLRTPDKKTKSIAVTFQIYDPHLQTDALAVCSSRMMLRYSYS